MPISGLCSRNTSLYRVVSVRVENVGKICVVYKYMHFELCSDVVQSGNYFDHRVGFLLHCDPSFRMTCRYPLKERERFMIVFT